MTDTCELDQSNALGWSEIFQKKRNMVDKVCSGLDIKLRRDLTRLSSRSNAVSQL